MEARESKNRDPSSALLGSRTFAVPRSLSDIPSLQSLPRERACLRHWEDSRTRGINQQRHWRPVLNGDCETLVPPLLMMEAVGFTMYYYLHDGHDVFARKFCCLTRGPKSNGDPQSLSRTSKSTSQNKPFLFISELSQTFCYSDRRLIQSLWADRSICSKNSHNAFPQDPDSCPSLGEEGNSHHIPSGVTFPLSSGM